MTKQNEAAIALRWSLISDFLNEDQRCLFLGVEAHALGEGGISAIARATNSSPTTVAKGMEYVEQMGGDEAPDPKDFRPRLRVRRPGAGRPSLREAHPGLMPALMQLVEPDPLEALASPLLWTTQSRDRLAEALGDAEIPVSPSSVLELLKEEGFRVGRAKKPPRRDTAWPEPRDQFRLVSQRVALAQAEGKPVIGMELFRVSREGLLQDDAPPFTAGLRRWKEDRFSEEPSREKPADQCEVCGATRHATGVLVEPSSQTIDLALVTLKEWWDRVGAGEFDRASRLVVVVAGLAGNQQAMRQIGDVFDRAYGHMKINFEVLHLPGGIWRWRSVERRFTLATNNHIVGHHLERHEGTLTVPGRARRQGSQNWIERIGTESKVAMARYPLWNYGVPKAGEVR